MGHSLGKSTTQRLLTNVNKRMKSYFYTLAWILYSIRSCNKLLVMTPYDQNTLSGVNPLSPKSNVALSPHFPHVSKIDPPLATIDFSSIPFRERLDVLSGDHYIGNTDWYRQRILRPSLKYFGP